MLKKRVAALAAGFDLGQWAAALQHKSSVRKLDTPRRKSDEVSSWEGEGGALAITRAQHGPAPVGP